MNICHFPDAQVEIKQFIILKKKKNSTIKILFPDITTYFPIALSVTKLPFMSKVPIMEMLNGGKFA